MNPSTSGIWQSEITTSKARRPRPRAGEASSPSRIGRHRRPHVPAGEHLLEDAAIGGVVVDDEDAQALERLTADRASAAAAACGVSKSAVKWNVLPLPTVALDPHAAAHQLDQPQRDRQAEAGAAVAPRRRAVRLGEGLENLLLLLAAECRCRCR